MVIFKKLCGGFFMKVEDYYVEFYSGIEFFNFKGK